MMAGKLLSEAIKHSAENQFGPEAVMYLMGHSVLLGLVLGVITYAKLSLSRRRDLTKYDANQELEFILGLINDSSTIVFLCVGLSGMMILVNNNLARAFAIAAGIALVRMRISLGKERTGSNLLFGIIGGIACGLNELNVAWASTFIYLVLQTSLLLMSSIITLNFKKKEDKFKRENSNTVISTAQTRNP